MLCNSHTMHISRLRRYAVTFAALVGIYSLLLCLGSWSAVLIATCASGAIAATYLYRESVNKRIKWELESAETRWQLQHQRNGPGVVLESFTLGWFNLLLQSLWSPILEKHIAGLTGDLLQRVLNEVRQKNSHKSPWKYLDSILLEELRFGAVPPTFQNAVAKYDPEASLLTVTMDVRFNSSSAQAVMLLRTRVLPIVSTAFNVRLEATYVEFSGRLHLGFLLGPEAPGIKGIYYSFASRPNLDLAVQPLGLPLPPELLALTGALQGVLQRIISRRLVEPQRRFFDLHRMYTNRHIARVGGPGGLLQMVIHCARNLSAAVHRKSESLSSTAGGMTAAVSAALSKQQQAKTSGASTASKRVTRLATFCQVKLGKQMLRTPVSHHNVCADAVWDWQLSLALPGDLATAAAAAAAKEAGAGAAAGDECTIAVYEAQTVGDPVLLGKCKVTLSSLKMVPNTEPLTLTLPLTGTPAAAKANIQISLTWLKSTRPAQQRQKWQPQSEQVLQQQQQQQQQQMSSERSKSQSQQSVASTGRQQQQQQQQGHSRSQSNQSVSSLGLFSPGAVSAGSSASGGTVAAAAAPEPDQAVLGSKGACTETQGHKVQTGTTVLQPPRPSSQQGQQQQGKQQHQDQIASSNHRARISRSADSSPVEVNQAAKQQQQQQQGRILPAQIPHRGPRRSVSFDAGAAAAAAAGAAGGSLSAAATPNIKRATIPRYEGKLSPTVSRDTQTAAAAAAAIASAGDHHADQPAAGSSGFGSGNGVGSFSVSTPLALLSSVVQLQKQVELQQQQMMVLQQQLAGVSTRYEQLQQQCRRNAVAALLKGSRFILCNSDGSFLPVLLYLTSEQLALANGHKHNLHGISQDSLAACSRSSRGSSFSSSSSSLQRQQQETNAAGINGRGHLSVRDPQQVSGSLEYHLIIAALPDDYKGWKAAAKRRFAAVISRRGAGQVTSNGAVGSASGDIKQKKQMAMTDCRRYEAGVIIKSDLLVLSAIPVSHLRQVQASGQEDTGRQGANIHQQQNVASQLPQSKAHLDGVVLYVGIQSTADDLHDTPPAKYELYIPAEGNRRSRDEWLFALQQLVDGQLEHLEGL